MKKHVLKGLASIVLTLFLSMGMVFFAYAEEEDDNGVEQNQTVQETDDEYIGKKSETEIKTVTNSNGSQDMETSDDLEDEAPLVQNLEEMGAKIVLPEEAYVYTRSSVEPEVRVEVVDESGNQIIDPQNYTVTYENNINVGTATVNVDGIKENGYEGTISAEFEITVKSLANIKPYIKSTTYNYTGKDIKPTVSMKDNGVTLKSGEDYSVSYSSCKEVGTAKITVKGKGNYTGTTTSTYKIQLGAVSSVKTTPSYSSVKVSWKKVTGASGYAVYRKTSSKGKYTRIATIKSGSTVSYTNTKLKTNSTYYYMVRAYRTVKGKNIYSPYSKDVKQKVQVAAPSISSVKSESYSSLKVSWKKVSGASGYGIYRSTSKNGTYTRVGTAKGNSKVYFIDKSRTCGKTYYYKVKAYRTINKKNYYGSASAEKYGKTALGTTKFSSYSERYADKVTLKWSKVSGASGYAIYRSTSKDGTYTRVKTITDGKTVKWTNSGLKKGKIYYYKIRAYKKVSGKTVYAKLSSAYKKDKGGWKYVNGYKLYYSASGKLTKDVSKIIGKQSSYVIKVNKRKNTVTVYAKDGSKGYIIPVKAFICSTGKATPLGTFYTPAKYRWHTLMGPCWGQWNTRVVGGILFHSVFYSSRNNNMTLSTSAYNKLGTTASHGCIRLTAGDAKWIYDNCKLKTKVIIYNSNTSGPLGKPTAYKLKSSHRWDPTDPNAYYKCKKKGCH